MSAKFPRGGGSKPILSHPSKAFAIDTFTRVAKALANCAYVYRLARSFAERPEIDTKFAVGFLHMYSKEVFERSSKSTQT